MKIRTWLLITYFIVMVLPLVAIYFLFTSVTSYYEREQVEEYLQAFEQIQKLVPTLDHPSLYKKKQSIDPLLTELDEGISITMFNAQGIVLYESTNEGSAYQMRNSVYQDLYDMKQELRSFTYKQPVFDGETIVGVFEIQVSRDQLIETIINQGWIVTSLFILIFILIYIGVIYFVHTRITKQLNRLMNEMSAFAKGGPIEETAISTDEIGELKRHFYTMRKQIIAAQEKIVQEQKEKEFMIATISHDLKTPLTSIKAYAESLNADDHLSTEEQQSYRQVIMEKSDFIKQMLDDLTIHSLLQSQEYQLELVTVDGEEFFEMLVSDYEPLSKQKNLCLYVSNNVTGTYEVNPQQLIRVVDNLVSNAIQHTETGRSLWIHAFSKEESMPESLFTFIPERFTFYFDQYAYIIVQNEGIGIHEEQLEIIFEPLYQVDEARSKQDTSGTGLGLSISKQIIEKHGGLITALSKRQEGTCFICAIPKKGAR